MYQLSGGGYGGNSLNDGISNGCSTIGISKAPPVEIMEQKFPVLYNHYSLHDKSSGAGEFRGGFGLDYEIEILCKEATASFVMDHGRYGPPGVLGGTNGGKNKVKIKEGMILSNEPGFYKKNKFGIRIENLIYIAQKKGKLFFENLTFATIDKDLIDEKMLTKNERKYLFNYHFETYSKISPFLNKKQKKWLAKLI